MRTDKPRNAAGDPQLTNRAVTDSLKRAPAGTPGPSLKRLSKAEAKTKYEQHLKDNPTGNVAYFDAWESLSHSEQRKWRDPLYMKEVA